MSRRKRSGVSLEVARCIADSADLPDGAYFAMVGDLMGLDYDEACLAMVEEDTASRPPRKGPGRKPGPGSPYATTTERNRARRHRKKANQRARAQGGAA